MLKINAKTIQNEIARIQKEIEYLQEDFAARHNHPIDIRACAERARRLHIELVAWADKIEHLQQSCDFGAAHEN